MAKYKCKYCESGTDRPDRICKYCEEKRELWRTIRAMLMPYYLKKQKRGRKREN